MTDRRRPPSPPGTFAIAPATIDDLSTIRYIHAQSLRAANQSANEDEHAAYAAHVYAPAYSDALADAIRSVRLVAGFIDGRPVATCGWTSVDDDTTAARIRWCHVLPMFGRLGLGLTLLGHIETAAEQAGHTTLVARSSLLAAGFFERAGYGITARGTSSLGSQHNFPVAFLRKNLRATREPPLF